MTVNYYYSDKRRVTINAREKHTIALIADVKHANAVRSTKGLNFRDFAVHDPPSQEGLKCFLRRILNPQVEKAAIKP